jgi:hypothetical protein
VPAAIKLAVVPETVQTADVVEAKLTVRPELAVAESVSCVPAGCVEIVPKVMIWLCTVGVVPLLPPQADKRRAIGRVRIAGRQNKTLDALLREESTEGIKTSTFYDG